jgi:hypothetical protein
MVVRTHGGSFAEWLTTNVRFALAEHDALSARLQVRQKRTRQVRCCGLVPRGTAT